MLANTIQLRHAKLIGTRVIWIVSVSTTLLYLVAGLPRLLSDYGLPCGEDLHPSPSCIVVETGLRSLGLDWSFYAWYSVIWITAVGVSGFTLFSLLAWQKRDEPKMLLFSIALLVGMVMNTSYSLPDIIVESYPATKVVVFILSVLGQISIIVFYVFPDGRFVPGWTRWMAVMVIVLNLAAESVYWWKLPYMSWLGDPVRFILWVIFPLTLPYALLYRYHKAADLEQRQQIKWIVWAVAFGGLWYVVDSIIGIAGNRLGRDASIPTWYSLYQVLISPAVLCASAMLLSVCFYIAISRYRLWNIDLFINRSLVYGGLTILLGIVMTGIFTATQALLGLMVKNMQAGASGIVSVMVMIALFLPVRDRLQRFVDSRVYGVDPSHERAVQAAIAQERDRLSRELHDSVTQSLYGLTIMAESCQRLARDNGAKNLEEPVIEMGDVARQALKEMRLLIHELRPPVLEQEGLLSALHQRLAAVERRSGTEASLVTEKVVDLPLVVEEALYHIAIEALNNAIQHAEATSVSISLHVDDRWVEMEVTDDGKGFDSGTGRSNGGMGLGSMHKRTEKLGGTLTVHSAPGQGTKVVARISCHTNPQKRRTKVVP